MRTAVGRRRASLFRPAAVVILFLVVVLGGLWALGVINLSALRARASTAGLVPVPVSAVNIPLYTKVTRDHLWDVKNNRLAVVYLRPQQVTPEMFTNVRDIFGRVLDHSKAAGYTFTEADFLPRGTRPGLVGGIPAGKRAVRVDAEKVQGLFGLLPGDWFDLAATIPIDASGRFTQNLAGSGVYGRQLDLQARITNWQKQATVQMVVQNGVVVEPQVTRQVPVTARTLTQGTVTRMKSVQEIVIAVDPGEVVRLMEALAVDAEISCVPRSGRSDDPPHSRTPDLQPRSPFAASGTIPGGTPSDPRLPVGSMTTIETISGTKRELLATPVTPGNRR